MHVMPAEQSRSLTTLAVIAVARSVRLPIQEANAFEFGKFGERLPVYVFAAAHFHPRLARHAPVGSAASAAFQHDLSIGRFVNRFQRLENCVFTTIGASQHRGIPLPSGSKHFDRFVRGEPVKSPKLVDDSFHHCPGIGRNAPVRFAGVTTKNRQLGFRCFVQDLDRVEVGTLTAIGFGKHGTCEVEAREWTGLKLPVYFKLKNAVSVENTGNSRRFDRVAPRIQKPLNDHSTAGALRCHDSRTELIPLERVARKGVVFTDC